MVGLATMTTTDEDSPQVTVVVEIKAAEETIRKT